MKRILPLLLFLILPLSAFAHLPPTTTMTNSLAPMLQKVTPAIVNVYVEEEKMTNLNEIIPTNDNQTKIPIQSYSVGSGVIFDAKKGLIVTNAHVVNDAKSIIVTLKNGERYRANCIAKDKGYDIAILKIDAKHLTQLAFSDSDHLKVGDFVTAIGSPYGLSQTVTSGVVSALNRTHPKIEGYQSFIQTDAPINPGNSGGALVNMQGQLVGINTAMVAPTDGSIGLGFSIPSDMVKSVIDQLLEYGKVKRGALGVIVQNISPDLEHAMHLATTKGALVSEVLPNTPAAKAGLKPEDVITAVNHHPVHGAVQLQNTMGLIRPNTSVLITYLRDDQSKIDTKTISVTVADPRKLKEKASPYFAGLRLQDFSEIEKDGTETKGVLVASVADTSAAALAGVKPGDIITSVNEHSITSLESLENVIKNKTRPLLLNIVRDGSNILLVLKG